MTFDQVWQREKVAVGFDFDSVSQLPSGQPLATSLVPLEHFHSVSRMRFIAGIVLGALVSLSATIPASKYFYNRRNAASRDGIPGQGIASNSNTSNSNTSNSNIRSDAAPAPLPAVADPLVDNPNQASQQTVRLSRLAANHWAGSSLPVRSQPPALVAAPQPASGITSSRVQGTEHRTEGGTKSANTLEKLWSGVQAGNLNSTLKLADLYARGDGVTANCPQARVLLMMASKKGSAEAARRLQGLGSVCPSMPGE
jgi:hypothetical protein